MRPLNCVTCVLILICNKEIREHTRPTWTELHIMQHAAHIMNQLQSFSIFTIPCWQPCSSPHFPQVPADPDFSWRNGNNHHQYIYDSTLCTKKPSFSVFLWMQHNNDSCAINNFLHIMHRHRDSLQAVLQILEHLLLFFWMSFRSCGSPQQNRQSYFSPLHVGFRIRTRRCKGNL